MKMLLLSFIYLVLTTLLLHSSFINAKALSRRDEVFGMLLEKGLFEADEVLTIKLSGNFKELFSDRGEKVQQHPIVVSYASSDSNQVSVNATVKSRGHFRKEVGNCLYPPLLLQFEKSENFKSSIFKDQTKLKLVMPCQGEEYIVREWMV
ncbi:MAG: hypothetical protein M3040_03550, partial [Bacteroidota bacterium]|nr:hypothetical protein [Bacteroidota bacterium]